MRPDIVARARDLAATGRALLGICGAPGAGKSTFAAELATAVGPAAVVVPMDGFHLDEADLRRLGLADVKGAPDTFDVCAYVALLRRLRQTTDRTVHAPAFDRSRERTVVDAIAVTPGHRLVVTEGNYLLHDAEGWRDVRPLLDQVWFVELPDEVRVPRLVHRHVEHGRSQEAAEEWVMRSDEANARLVARTKARADLVVQLS